ncbi:ketosteroid isomerase family protein [Nonomuraea sp. NPDC003709]|uniref:ketosteroid isomerase family protein n=1 Tax=Nonomuraea sp. NPDC003709 TaxID=3154450 RepID=UPI0033A96ECE
MGEDYASEATQFIESYYSTFDTNFKDIGSMYRESSVLIYTENRIDGSGDPAVGVRSIVQKLQDIQSWPGAATVKHDVDLPIDVLPMADGSLLVVAQGEFRPSGELSLNFADTFVLMQDGGAYYIGYAIINMVDFIVD